MSSSENTGLGLFDDTASAAGNFPSSLRGYDRNAVDEYVRSLESKNVAARRRAAELEQQLGELSTQLTDARQQASEVDYTNLGGRASDILRLAEEQARETLDRASTDAERIREEARRDADETRQNARREGNDLKSGGLAQIEEVRTRMEEDGRAQADRSRSEAEALVAAARRQAESLQRTAEHDAQTVRQQAYLDTEELQRSVQKEVAELRHQVAVERELAATELRRMQEEASERTAALLAEATQHNQESAERLEADIVEAARIRTEALADAERVKVAAIRDAEERLDTAKNEASAINERTQQEFTWRKEQLRRETDLLAQRKQAVLNQLASLSALAQQTAQNFPDMDELEEFDAEQGDRTILRPAGATPALPEHEQPQGSQEQHRSQQRQPRFDEQGHRQAPAPVGDEDATAVRPAMSTAHEAAPDPGHQVGEEAADREPVPDGDQTIVIPPDQIPAGIAHRQAGPAAEEPAAGSPAAEQPAS